MKTSIKKLFTEHPNSIGETYLEHMTQAMKVACKCQVAAVTQLLHAVFPFIKPPLNTDVCSMINYLHAKIPDTRKNCNENSD
tara:strand:- start:407 stop:652 length:246 start_codon:yes stop_codon:yes gene_type:complete